MVGGYFREIMGDKESSGEEWDLVVIVAGIFIWRVNKIKKSISPLTVSQGQQ